MIDASVRASVRSCVYAMKQEKENKVNKKIINQIRANIFDFSANEVHGNLSAPKLVRIRKKVVLNQNY